MTGSKTSRNKPSHRNSRIDSSQCSISNFLQFLPIILSTSTQVVLSDTCIPRVFGRFNVQRMPRSGPGLRGARSSRLTDHNVTAIAVWQPICATKGARFINQGLKIDHSSTLNLFRILLGVGQGPTKPICSRRTPATRLGTIGLVTTPHAGDRVRYGTPETAEGSPAAPSSGRSNARQSRVQRSGANPATSGFAPERGKSRRKLHGCGPIKRTDKKKVVVSAVVPAGPRPNGRSRHRVGPAANRRSVSGRHFTRLPSASARGSRLGRRNTMQPLALPWRNR